MITPDQKPGTEVPSDRKPVVIYFTTEGVKMRLVIRAANFYTIEGQRHDGLGELTWVPCNADGLDARAMRVAFLRLNRGEDIETAAGVIQLGDITPPIDNVPADTSVYGNVQLQQPVS